MARRRKKYGLLDLSVYLMFYGMAGFVGLSIIRKRKIQKKCEGAPVHGAPPLSHWMDAVGELTPEVVQLVTPKMRERIAYDPGFTDEKVVDDTVEYFIPDCVGFTGLFPSSQKILIGALERLARQQGAKES